MSREKKPGIFSKLKDSVVSPENEGKLGYFYGIVLIFLIIVALIIKFSPSDNKNTVVTPKENTSESEVIIDYERDLNSISNNYELDIVVNKYYFNEYVNIKNQDISKLINIKKFDSNNTYTQDDKIEEDIDMTFITPQNLLKLLNAKSYNVKNKYMIETNKWLEVYNEINNTQVVKTISGEITVEILSDENNELSIIMDLTNLYKNLNFDYERVIYNMKYYNINKINLSNNN